MLDPWVIEEIRRREEKRRQEKEREQPQIPLYDEPPQESPPAPMQDPEKKDRGVTIITPDGSDEESRRSTTAPVVIRLL